MAFSLVLGVAVILMVAWSIDWVFVFKVWPHGIEQLRELLAHDVAHGIALAAQQGRGAGAITAPANALYSIVFEATGVHDMGLRFADATALAIPDTVIYRGMRFGLRVNRTAIILTRNLGRLFPSSPRSSSMSWAAYRSHRWQRSRGCWRPV